MKVTKREEAGFVSAMEGLSLSYLQPVERMPLVARALAERGEPHCKFMRQMIVWVRIVAPWYFWRQMATYRLGCETQSSSTMHTLLKRPLRQNDFEKPIEEAILRVLNDHIARKDILAAENILPGGFVYTRVVSLSYSAISNIISQRYDHLLPEWQIFIEQLLPQLDYPEFFRHFDFGGIGQI